MSKLSKRYLIYTIPIFLLIIPFVAPYARLDQSSLNKINYYEGLGLAYPPIVITNWSETAQLYDWCSFEHGSYIVENLSFSINNLTALSVANTTEPFIIKNCNFTSSTSLRYDTGIKLVNSSNGILIRNSFSFVQNSIIIENSFNISVLSNEVDCSEMHSAPKSIRLVKCTNSSIRENLIVDSYHGIYLMNCNYTEVENNNLEENNWWIVSYSINNCVFYNNTISQTYSIGIAFIENCYFNTINENVMTNYYQSESQDGITLWHDSSNNSIVKNKISDNGRYGIDLRDSLGNNVFNNSLLRNKCGIRFYKSNYSTVMYNYITYYETCILETDTDFNTLEHNTCEITFKFVPGYNFWILCLIFASTVALLTIRKSQKLC